jgi:N-acetylneuraminic acid mutarotase
MIPMQTTRKLILSALLLLFMQSTLFATQGAWTTAGFTFPAITRAHYFQFLINGKAYIGSGSYVNGSILTFTRDVWEFDPVAGTWTQRADFGGNVRTGTLNFQVGNYGYAGCGADQFAVYNDFWKFDPDSNQWSQIAFFPGPPRVYGQGFGAETTGYAGMGRTFTAAGSTITYNDIYEYNPINDTWTPKTNFPGITRSFASTFKVGGYNYLLAGQSGNPVNQLWKYDASTDTWMQKSSFPAANRIGMSALVIQDTAYAGLGRSQDPTIGVTTYYNDMWRYDYHTDTWVQYTSMPAAARFRAFGFGIDTIGYVGCGENVASAFNDVWLFNPRLTTINVGINEINTSDILCRYNTQEMQLQVEGLTATTDWDIQLYTSNGQSVFTTRIKNTSTFNYSTIELANGVYIFSAKSGNAVKSFRFVK